MARKTGMREQGQMQNTPQQHFTLAEVQELFGVEEARVLRWLVRGLLGEPDLQVLIRREALKRFIRQKPQRFSLARVDQSRFRELILEPAQARVCLRDGGRK